MSVVIVGAGQAGATAAAALREAGYTDRITLLTDETERPYEHPPLSKDYLKGDQTAFAPIDVPDDVDYRTDAKVTGVDVDAGTVTAGDETVHWDDLLLAPGVQPKVLDVPNAGKATFLRNHHDSDRLRERLQQASKVVIVGAGWIGCEVAAAARDTYGCEVVLLADQDTPVNKLGPEIGNVFAELHREHGVDVRTGVEVTEVFHDGDATTGVSVKGGDRIDADLVVMAAGSDLDVSLAEAAGCAIDDSTGGVAVDASLRTSVPHVWAVGDIAAIDNPVLGKRVRVEHWALALDGAKVAARSIAGQADAAIDFLPFFFSDQYDFSMEYCGNAAPGSYDQVVFRGEPTGKREFIAFWVGDGGRVMAAMNANIFDVNETLQSLIASKRTVDAARLADPDVPLDEL